MSQSALETHGPSLEQILWRAMDRWQEQPALVDAEEFAAHIAGVFAGDVPAEAWVERFFAGPEKLPQKLQHEPPADMAEAIVRATTERLHVYEFHLQRLEYVVVEDEKQVVVVSDFGQFALQNDDLTRRAIDSAVLPKGPQGKGEPRGYLVRKSGEVVAIDVKKVAASLQQFVVRQVSAPAVDKPGARLAPFSPRKRAMSEAREEQALRQDSRARQALPLRLKPQEEKPAQKGPPAAAQTALFLLMPDGQLARAEIGSATRWREMVGNVSRSGTEVTGAQSITIRAGNVVAIINKDGSFTLPGSAGERALARGEAIAAVRSDAAPVRVLSDDALDDALARGARVVPGLQQGNRFWIQPERAFTPDAPEQTVAAGQPLRLGEITGDPWADWALTGGGEMPLEAMMALRGRTRHALRAALDRPGDDLSIPPELADRVRGPQAKLEFAGAPVVGFRSADGTVIVTRPQGPIRLAALDRGRLDPLDLPLPAPGPVDLVPRSGAVPATALAALQLALERTAMAGGYKLPLGRLDSASDALDVGNAMQLSADDPRRTSVRLAGPHFLGGATGQTAQLVLSMPFPNQGEIHVGNDLAQALQAYLSAPVMPARSGGLLLKLRGGQPALMPEDLPLDWSALHQQAALKAQDAVVTLDLPDVQPLVSSSASTAGLPFLLRRALAHTADWVPGPGAPMPDSIRALALGGPFDQFSPGEIEVQEPVFRPPNPGEQEIVIPMPLWAEMGRARISETDQIMASPLAPAGYQPPLGVYRLAIPQGGPVDMTGGAPAGTPDIVDLAGPIGLELLARSSGSVTAKSLGGRQFLGRVALDDGESVVTRRGRIRIGDDSDSDLSKGGDAPSVVSSPPSFDGTYSAPSSGLAMAGAANAALAMSADLDSRQASRPTNLDQSSGGTPSGDNSNFSAQAKAAGQADAASSPDYTDSSDSDQTLVVAGAQGAVSGAEVGAAVGQASRTSSQASSAASSASSQLSPDTPSFITGLRPGMWSGHDRRLTAGYQTWSYGSARQDLPQTVGGVDLMSLSKPVYPSLPTALRFRYVGAPLWWSSSTAPGGSAAFADGSEDDSTPAARALRSGLRAATSAASIWRSIFIASPQWGDDASFGMDTGQDANAAEMSSLSRRFEELAAGTLVAGGGAGDAAATGGAYIATTSSGRAGAVNAGAAARAKAESVEMSIVAAIPPRPPPIESMSSSVGSAAHARGKAGGGAPHAQSEHKEAADAVTASKIEGSVDAIAQRIYHRIRRRIESDRERFGG